MERDEDEQDLNPTNSQEPGQDTVGDARGEDDGPGPEAPNASD